MIIVTGANGYVGSQVIKLLASQKAEALALVRSQSAYEKVRQIGGTPIVGDVTDVTSLEAAFKGVDKVIHLAAVNRNRGALNMQNVNAQGTINVVDAAKRAGVKHMVMVVGLGADASKPYPLAQTQGLGVDYLIKSGLDYTILEASVVFGEGDEFINTLAGLARIPLVTIVPGDGRSKFQPIAVQDVAACAVQSLSNPAAKNRRLQICGAQVMTLEDIIDAILSELNLRRWKLHMPVSILKVAVSLMDKILPKAPITPSLLAQLGVDNVADNNATETVFGIVPARLTSGISYVHNMNLSKLIMRSLGRIDYR